MSTHGGGTRSSGGGRSRSGSKGSGVPRQGKAPWEMTYDQFLHYEVPATNSDASRSPGDIPGMKEEDSTLADYTGSDRNARFSLDQWLGRYSSPEYDSSHLADAVRAGRPVTMYRATSGEHEIWPGAYVTLSRTYAEEHGRRYVSGAHHVISATAYPDELVVVNPQEFWYAPRDLHAWHEQQVRAAVKAGEPVPENVRAEYGL